MSDTLSLAAAIDALPDGDTVHTFRSYAGLLVGLDISRQDAIERLTTNASNILISGPAAQGMKHGIAIEDEKGFLFIATKGRTDEQAGEA